MTIKNWPKMEAKFQTYLDDHQDDAKHTPDQGKRRSAVKNPNGHPKPENRYPFLVEKLPLPGHVKHEKRTSDSPTYRGDWEWIARAVGGEGPFWFRVHRDAPNPQVASDINTGKNRYIDPTVYQAAATKVQSTPDLYDIYLRVRPPEPDMSPKGGSESADEWIDAQRARIAELRREWRERWQLEWMHEERRRQREAGLEH